MSADYEVPFSQALIDTVGPILLLLLFADRPLALSKDNDGFLALLREYSDQLEELQHVWDPVVEGEISRARPAVEKEISRITELAGTLKTRRDAQRRRVRRQRASVYEWSEGVHAVESTRVAHVSLIVFVFSPQLNPSLSTDQARPQRSRPLRPSRVARACGVASAGGRSLARVGSRTSMAA